MAEKSAKKRRSITLALKREIVLLIETKKKTQADIVRNYGISKSTVSDIWSNREKYKTSVQFADGSKKMRKSTYNDVEDALFLWLKQARSLGAPVSGPIMKEKAVSLAVALGHNEFKCSDGWLDRFKKRRAVIFRVLSGESESVTQELAADWLQTKLPRLLDQYDERNVFNALLPTPQSCSVKEEPEDSDDEQPRYQKTFKRHERIQKLKEKDKQQSPARGTPGSPHSSSPPKHAGSRSPDNIPVITHVMSLTSVRMKRTLGPNRENGEIKRARIRDRFDSNTPGSPSTPTAPPEVCSPPVLFSPVGNCEQTAQKDYETVPKDDDDEIMIIESISSLRPKSASGTFDITKVKSECMVSEEALEKPVEHGDSDTVVSMETTTAASPLPPPPCPVSTRDVSIGIQSLQNLAVKEEKGHLERRNKEMWSKDDENNTNHFESEKDLPPVERNTNKELKSIKEETRAQQKNVSRLQEENQERNEAKSTVNLEEELSHRDVSDKISPGGQTSAKLENSVLDVLEAQKQQDTLLELLEVAANERDESRSQLIFLSSQVEELRSQLLELTQNTLKKENSHNSTQTNPEEEQDYKKMYLQGKEEIKQLQDKLSELMTEKEKERERKGQGASLESEDELACQIDCLLRELDQRNKERDELKDKVDSLISEKCNLSTYYERLKKNFEEVNGEREKVKVNVKDHGVQTDIPISSHEESATTSAEASNSGRGRDSHSQQHETQDRPEIKQESNNTETHSLRLRELRQRVARLLVTFVPALDLQQVNYDCEVIDEILTQIIDEILPTEAAST